MMFSSQISSPVVGSPLNTAQAVIQNPQTHADSTRAQTLRRFFKTGKGQYGEGDVFWGLYVPVIRDISKQSVPLSHADLSSMLSHEAHEVCLCALLVLGNMFKKAAEAQRADSITLYVQQHMPRTMLRYAIEHYPTDDRKAWLAA